MNIDGHTVRIDSIDAVTEIEVTVRGVQEGTDKVARGQFDILIHGQKLSIARAQRFAGHDEPKLKAAVKGVRDALTEIRDPVIAVIG